MVKAKSAHKKVKACAIVLALALAAVIALGVPRVKAGAATYFTVDVSQQLQQMDGWGTSLCWWADAVGGWDMEGASGKQKREEISDYVFGADGLNINVVRYNIPGGDDPSHTHMVDNRGMLPLKETSVSPYKWSNGQNQFWILDKAAQLRGEAGNDLIVETFNNSPPYWMTESGCASGGASKSAENLARDNYAQFAAYYADVVDYIQNTMGIPVDYVEVMNEPGSDYWGAGGSQEGNKVNQGASQSLLIKAVYDEMTARGMLGGENLKFTAPDETNPGLAYSSYNKLDDTAKGIVDKLNYHIYSKSDNDRKNMRSLSYESAASYEQDKKLWMSEICYGTTTGKEDADNHDSLTNVFDLANDIYKDLYLGGVNAWVIWQAVESDLSNRTYGNNYGLIHGVYQEPGNNEYGLDMDGLAINRGDYYITKQYYAMGQYSKYIKAGYRLVKSPDSDLVAAISPEGDEVVIVRSHSKDYAENQNFYVKGFEIESAKQIVTDQSNNWAESSLAANGSYVSADIAEKSITTLVLKGRLADSSAASGIFFNGFVSRNSTLRADFYATDAGASYKLFYSADKTLLPVYGGSGAEEAALAVAAANKDYSVSIPNKTRDKYYAVIQMEKGGAYYYSSVLEASSERLTGGEFAYFTSSGRQNKLSYEGSFARFGENFGIADQPFGADPFSGKKWGYTTADTGEYQSNDVFNALRYSNENELSYKYEVAQNKAYNVVLGFKDAWGVKNRAMSLLINGADTGQSVTDTSTFRTLAESGVSGVADTDGKYYITVTLKKDAGTTEKPAVNFISLQEEEGAEVAFRVNTLPDIKLAQGETLASVLPASVEVVTSKGIVSSSNYTVQSVSYANALVKGGGSIAVTARENTYGLDFEFEAAAVDTSEKIYYYIDAGCLSPSAGAQSAFDQVRSANETLVNTDTMDKYSSDGSWGRLNGAANFANYWENDKDKMTSIIEGKYVTGTGGAAQTHIQYLLTNLPAGEYVVEVGCDVKNWGSKNRDVSIKLGDTLLGKKSNYSGVNLWTFDYLKADGADVIFDMYTEGTGRANPVLSYVLVKKVTAEAGLKLKTPVLPAVLDRHDTELTITNLDEGALLILTDDSARLLGERKVTAGDASGGFTLTGLDLSRSAKVEAKQFKSGVTGGVAIAEVPQIALTSPRLDWSAQDDVILVSAKSESGIQSIAYRYGTTGSWTEIKDKKFFRAELNGTYYVRMITKSNVEIVETVTIDRVDTVVLDVVNDLTAWTDADIDLKLSFAGSVNPISRVEVVKGEERKDITSTLAGGNYSYKVTENCELQVVATTSKNSVKSFDLKVDTIDKNAARLDCALTRADGVDTLVLGSSSLGDVKYSWSFEGGAYNVLYGTKKALVKSGTYKFKMENMLGKTDERSVVYASKFTADGAAKASFKKEGEALKVAFELPYGYTGVEVTRLDGAGGKLSIEEGGVTITENGEYALIATKANGDLLMTAFEVTELNKLPIVTEKGCGGVALGGGSLTGSVVLAAAALIAVVLLLARRKSNAK